MAEIAKYTLKMQLLGNYLTFRNRPGNRPREVLYSRKERKKEPVKVLYPKKGSEEGTGEGSKKTNQDFLKEPLR